MEYADQRAGSIEVVVSGIKMTGYLYEFKAAVLVRVKAILTYLNAGLLLYFHQIFCPSSRPANAFQTPSK